MTALASGVAAGQEMGGAAYPGAHVEGELAPALPGVRALPQRRLPQSRLPAQVVLDRVEAAHLKMEATDQPSKPGVPLQIGVSRDVPMLRNTAHTSALMSWTSIPGGQIAAISITSPDALGLRLGLLVEKLSRTALLRFYAQGTEQVFEVSGGEIMDTIARNLAAGDASDEARTYWSPVIDGQEMTVEIELPTGVSPDEVMFSIPRVSHLFSSPLDPGALQQQIGEAAGCTLDSACYTSTWGNESLATAKMTFTKGGGSYLCTGTLMNDSDPSTFIPYFLTANHCISTQTVASTLQTYWFYRASSCNAGLLNPSTQTLTSGAALLYASSITDTGFLLLNSSAPPGAVYSGWSTYLPVLSSQSVGIHHPQGDLQKISAGNIAGYYNCTPNAGDTFSCFPTSSDGADHLEVVFGLGITEGGSSGSGLWIVSGGSHYLVGQLHGGNISCVMPTSPVYYGRFDVAYNAALFQWLGTTPVNYTLSVTGAGTGQGTVTGPGINCTISAASTSGTCSANYASGTGVSLIATSIGVSTFIGWGGDCAADGTVTLEADKICTATFIRPLILSTTSLSAEEQGVAYVYALQAEGGLPSYTWSRIKGKLPKGLTLDAAGTLSGIPTKAKTATFTVQVADAAGASVTQNLSLQIVKRVDFKTKKLSRGTVGTPYAATLKTKGGIPPLTFSLVGGALPTGLTLDPGTGQVSGTPTVAGIFDFVAQVTSSGGSSHQRNIRITIR
ncbi:MAG: Ig domain-containing protein [Kofleriaceae bacterium]|nr:Ig domain-containing protein [Candidatus Methylomirabilis lanthanidiphila]